MKQLLATIALATAFSLPLWAQESYVAKLNPTEGSVTEGVVVLSGGDDGISVKATVSGLKPNSKHGFHIHEFGDITSADGKSAGGHFNPAGNDHGLPGTAERHAGDMGNLEADENGVAEIDMTLEEGLVPDGLSSLNGRAIVIHADPDDGGQPTGNAGARIAVGVIGLGNPESDPMENLKEANTSSSSIEQPGPVEESLAATTDSLKTALDNVLEQAGEALDNVSESVEEETTKKTTRKSSE